jgi:Recombination endonuclease VII
MSCANPECRNEKIFARGYCQGCYSRLKKRGTLERAYVINNGTCSIENCGAKSFAKNLCEHHYRQAEDPLKTIWRNLRSRYPGQFPESWGRFDVFLADVGRKPDGDYQLRRTRTDVPWAKDNCTWIKLVPKQVAATKDRREYQSDYAKVWSDLTKFGVTRERRAEMLASQGGVCAICLQPETAKNPHHPELKPRRLSIDHCHKAEKLGIMKVRSLLCVRCNHVLGLVNDDLELLRIMIAYLERHAATSASPSDLCEATMEDLLVEVATISNNEVTSRPIQKSSNVSPRSSIRRHSDCRTTRNRIRSRIVIRHVTERGLCSAS